MFSFGAVNPFMIREVIYLRIIFLTKNMYLSKTMYATRNPASLLQFSRMGFAAKEYDVAVIGGGPGGEYKTGFLYIDKITSSVKS